MASATSLESTEPEVASTAIPARDRGVVQRLFDAIIAPRSMSFLVSMVVHLAILLILAVFSVSLPGVGNVLSILSGTVEVDGSETPTFEVSAESILDQPMIQEESTMVESEMAIVQPTDSLPSTFDPSTKPKLQIEGSESLRQTDMANAGMFAGAAFQSTKIDSRLGQNRRQVAMARGGTPQSEQAVEDALVWLAAHQFADGGWSLHVDHPDCMGKCQHGTQDLDPKRVAATGLALLCFLGAGYTDQEGPYTEQVRKGIYFLTQKIRITSHGGQFTEAHVHSHMYEQGIATLALCEAYQMSRDQSFKNECQEAINYIRYAQHTDGGWDYNPKGPGDLSIACWQIMAMKSAVGAELTVPFDSIKAFDRFLDSQQTDGGAKYGYRVPMAKPSTTAMGLLMRMYRGWSKSDPRLMRGAKYIFEEGPSEYDVYLNYYATQVFFHMEGQYWEEWNPKLRDYLIRTQSQKGHEKGSWFFDGGLNSFGGRLYTTAMCCMTLEVYYRHMPIYGPIEFEDFEL